MMGFRAKVLVLPNNLTPETHLGQLILAKILMNEPVLLHQQTGQGQKLFPFFSKKVHGDII
jgi:hypothetical protein